MIALASPDQRTYDLSRFSLGDMTRCGIELRRLGGDASTMAEVGERVVRYLFERLRAPGLDAPACALVRMFATMPFAELDAEQRAFAEEVLGGRPERPLVRCLTLLASAGVEPAWNSRHTSVGHKVLPLPSVESIARAPMISQLMHQLGVEIGALVSADAPLVIDSDQHTFNVFYVPRARNSPYIPAQREFVEPYGIESVLGFGGLLPSGELFTVILFAKVHVTRDIADLFRTLALNVKVAILPFSDGRAFG